MTSCLPAANARIAALAYSVTPVSYTHLDVYKRQPLSLTVHSSHPSCTWAAIATSPAAGLGRCLQALQDIGYPHRAVIHRHQLLWKLRPPQRRYANKRVLHDRQPTDEQGQPAIVTPVSYTHLDVYKRQGLASPMQRLHVRWSARRSGWRSAHVR